ncbi:MAG: ABC transporter ATP-binding protein [Steroidobacteraceae bacterium]
MRGAADPLLAIERLGVRFASPDGAVDAVTDFWLAVRAGECVGIVGESGAGKSQAMLAVMGLLAGQASISGSARFDGRDLLAASPAELRDIRGAHMAMIFQDPMTALTPHLRIGDQIAESLVRHRGATWRDARRRARELLDKVHVSDAGTRLRQYPHELSGGMRQRVMLAIALACEPRLLIADEPTTALDVTIQAEILALLAELKREQGMAVALITHDFGVVAGLADRVAVMYAGRLIEEGSVRAILESPRHPYTAALLASMPRLDTPRGAPLAVIHGQPPNARALPPGCAFHPRCTRTEANCSTAQPALTAFDGGCVACHHPLAAARAPAGRP